ncbi:MAG: glycyl-radical enzyme activating protein [Thermosyntropha sp.]|nr:glycyl-radical enzyme activating protein [Thermosyntropha sp.]
MRSVIFFKGCPLRCVWCHNPESWSMYPELAFKKHLCINCGYCMDICPEKAIKSPGHWDRERCRLCFTCVQNCPSGALEGLGLEQSVESILESLRPEYTYYKNSGGGVTFSGGEPTLFSGFAAELADRLRSEGVHLAAETCGLFNLDGIVPRDNSKILAKSRDSAREVWNFLSKLDLILFDIKIFDDVKHRQFCGTGNSRIKYNLETLAVLGHNHTGPPVWPRLPLIPDITNTTENLVEWGRFLRKINLPYLTLVPYHRLGESKREWIQIKKGLNIRDLNNGDLETAKAILKSEGITCYSPGEEEWTRLSEMG